MVEETSVETAPTPSPPKGPYTWATGRRKSAVARVRLRAGTGLLEVNGKPLEQFFNVKRMSERAVMPLMETRMMDKLDVFVQCNGGGITGQSDAMMMGVARALEKFNPTLGKELRVAGFMTRDARVVERKKYGRPKARKRFQFSKR